MVRLALSGAVLAAAAAAPLAVSATATPTYPEKESCSDGAGGSRICPWVDGALPIHGSQGPASHWTLVRRVRAGTAWHQATDQLNGTDVYGTKHIDPKNGGSFS